VTEGLLSVVLPVYNQADHLEEVVGEYRAALDRVPRAREIILVPNGCRDLSVEICQRLAAAHADVRTEPSERAGWGRAVRHGLAAARGDLLCYTNLARTSANDLALLALYAVAYPGVVVKANRKIRDGRRRRLGSLLYNLECRALFDLSYWDINGTPKVFPRAFEALTSLDRDDDLIDLEFNVVCRRLGYPVVEVPIFASRRHGGRSTTNLRSALRLYWGAWRMSRR
jgi:glycosyltransferase involved in cell wall biosynthesis